MGRVHSVHTLCPGRSRAARWVPYRNALGTVSQHSSCLVLALLRLCRHPPVVIQKLYHDKEAHAASAARHIARSTRCVMHAWRRIATPCREFCCRVIAPCCCPPATIQNFVSRHTMARTCASALLAPMRRSTVLQPIASRVIALLRRVVALLRRVVARCWSCRA